MPENMNANDVITMHAVGDVQVSRKDWRQSFAKVEHILKKSDIAFFNCEKVYATCGSPGMAPHGAGPSDPSGMPALVSAGFNVCSFANNHAMDWGVDALVETIERLESIGISVCGAGRNISEARRPAIIKKKDTRVAFLGYNSVGPNWTLAEENKPGCAMIRAHTLYEPYDYQPGTPAVKVLTWAYREDLESMIHDIKEAKKKADIVVMTDHWGVHNVPAMLADYEFEVGHAAIDAGADLVLGTHTHILKGIEVYKGKVIVHSLANFANERKMAQEEGGHKFLAPKSFKELKKKIYGPLHPDQLKTIVLKCIISNRKIERISFVPVMLDEKVASPEALTHDDPRAQEIFRYMKDITQKAGLSTQYRWDGDEVVVDI